MSHPDATLQMQDAPAPVPAGPGSDPHAELIAGRYELRGVLAKGGMGTVHRGWDRVFQRRVAVKLMHQRIVAPLAIKRFEYEAYITGQLQHPSIPPVYDRGTSADGRPFLVMKLIMGGTLDELLKEPGRKLNAPGIFEAICQAVGCAHSLGVLHRDLKPVNIMVGAFGEVQVMDWGLAKRVEDREPPRVEASLDTTVHIVQDSDDDSKTTAGSVLGTPTYMPPEQAIGAVDLVTTRSDVFGLGGILCAMLTGRPVFDAKDAEGTRQLAALGRVEAAFARLDASGGEPELIALAKRCLAVEPKNRPADANEVAALVAKLRADADERARQAELSRNEALVREAETSKRRRLLVWSAALIGAELMAGVIIAMQQTRRAWEAEQATARQLQETTVAKKAAVAAKHKADEFRDKALDALRAATNDDVEKLIGSKPELTANERSYLESIAHRWQEFARLEAADDSSRAIQAEGHFLVASLWQKLGRRDESLAEFEAAIAMQKELVATKPDDAMRRWALVRSLSNRGVTLHELGRIKEGIAQFQEVLTKVEKLASEFPATLAYRMEQARMHHNLGVLLNEEGRRTDAEAHYRKAIAIQEILASEFPTNLAQRASLAASHDSLGQLLAAIGMRAEAEASFRKGLALREKLAEENPASADYGADLAQSLSSFGSILRQLDRKPEALEFYRRALNIRQALADKFPALPDHRSALAVGYSQIGNLLSDLRDFSGAEKEFRSALALQQQLVAALPTVPSYQLDLAASFMNLGVVISDQGRSAEAEKNYLAGLAIQEKLAAEHPGTPDYKIILGGSCCNLGNLKRDAGKAEDSLDFFTRAIAILRPVHERDPRAVVARKFLRNACWGRARAFDQLHQHKEALDDWDETIALSPPEQQPGLRVNRVLTKRCAGQTAEALAETDDLLKLPGWKPDDLLTFAAIHAYASENLPGLKTRHATTAVQLLRRAIEAGFKDAARLKTDPELAPLRDRDDFKQLLQQIAN